MATEMVRQTMFTAGEVDIQTWKRTDIESYLTACQSLLNAETGTTGLAKKRKGTKFQYDVTAIATDNSQTYEFVDNLGRYYLILSVPNGFYIFSVPAPGSSPIFVIDEEGHFVITDNGDFVTVGGNFQLATFVYSPYSDMDLQDLDYALNNDVLVFTHPLYPPARLYVSSYTPLIFTYAALAIFPPPALDFQDVNYSIATVAFTSNPSNFTMVVTGAVFSAAWGLGQIVGFGKTTSAPIGVGLITSVGVVGPVTTFTGLVFIPFAPDADMPTFGSQYVIKKPAFSKILGYPAKVAFYQNRLWFGNTQTLPNTIFGSKVNAPINFDVGAGNDTDAIIYTLGDSNSGAIQWINGGKQLEIYTTNYEFACPQNQDIGITPSTFSARQQSSYGASLFIKPLTYLNDSYFVTKTGNTVINFHFTGVGLAYESSNISAASSHLINNPLNRALLRGGTTNQDNFVYYVNSDGSMFAMQFAQQKGLAALTPLEFSRDNTGALSVLCKDVVTVNNSVYFLKKYLVNGKRTIEVFDTVKMDGYISSTMASNGIVGGLDQFNGYVVQAFFQNQDFGEYLVVGGLITVKNPNEYSGAIQIGILYPFRITPMYLFAGGIKSNFYKQIVRIFVDYYLSLDFEVNGTPVNYWTYADIQAGGILTPKTDTVVLEPFLGWDRFQTFSITQNAPFDCQILGISYQIDAKII